MGARSLRLRGAEEDSGPVCGGTGSDVSWVKAFKAPSSAESKQVRLNRLKCSTRKQSQETGSQSLEVNKEAPIASCVCVWVYRASEFDELGCGG